MENTRCAVSEKERIIKCAHLIQRFATLLRDLMDSFADEATCTMDSE